MNFKQYYLKESTSTSFNVLRRATKEDLKKVYDFGYTWSTEEHVDKAYIVDIKKDEELTPGIKLVVEFKEKNPLERYTVYDYNDRLGYVKFINKGPLVDAIKNWEFKQTLNPSTAKQFNELIDEL
jgi:hypothetical protein